MNNISDVILKIFSKKQKFDGKYNDLMINFLTKAYELVELSNDIYQVEHTIRLNKISLKDYILNSEICNLLKENNISNYSINELKRYMNNYEKQNMSDISSYRIALDLYEKLEEIEEIETKKINYEIDELSKIFDEISKIENVDKTDYENLYNSIINKIKEKYLDNNLIDDKLNNYIIQILNDIFNYYLYGNKEVPI